MKLPSNFELDRYGLHVRLVREDDAEFILSLRTNPKLSKYLHETDASVPKQREWIRQYKKRESAGEDYYLIFFYQNQPIGVIRIYHIDEIKKSAMAGSWVCSPNIPMHIPIYVLIICREIMFDNLHLEKDCFEVRKDNKQVQRLHLMMGAKIISVDEEKCYYELTREDFLREKESIIGILGC